MSYRAIALSLVAVVLVLGVFLFKKKQTPKITQIVPTAASVSVPPAAPPPETFTNQTKTVQSPATPVPQRIVVQGAPALAAKAAIQAVKIQPKEIKSVQTFLKTFVKFSQTKTKPTELVRELNSSGLKPVVAQDFNKDTGKMLVVRTDEVLPGTRYFHAQFFEDDQKRAFLQHMSFEFRPAPDNMERATEAVKANFKNLKLIKSSADYMLWQAPNDYIVWIQRMNSEDLQNDPFNAHGPEDVGTARVAVELDQHGAAEDSLGEAAHVH